MKNEIITFILAMLPVTELRGAIPYAILELEMAPIPAFISAVLGNIFVSIIILKLLGPVSDFFREHSAFFENFFDKLFKKTHNKHAHKFVLYGEIFLVLFVMIPLPGSGAWTGSLLAFLLGLKFRTSFPLITLGVVLSGVIVTLISTGVLAGLQAML
ncbi:ligand-binding protein SH3 [Candidatus Peregrinibacteria bacterium CG22_combo_CG10-13_8_21_14_all_44_10]|nr:MAG: hypothetical protein AUK45_04020 [Candidatus Peregrinibacteria bacterium CG2_30_44_17]PIP65819.1 MAG: ligand-binding protein SH3 [Candidatus Peregrinibacteria bacterium CG22_combo_CG10-13_8_21_14_all_44_10]PIS04170.1 MAG: ligand-binding protein SH3 [Candidatus Peregrinibacteria bacterium CG10_big_fil_rev_8_21_14_0_10_44_7]PIX80563.1 MAG: ligand-binding protein SH3 [Candidatus Peregrinibacteria bacterium CG_4_10_14_3_um_filter_44_21]PJB88829.1 MAG: ligand-binding protein SH3 [Candidatus 